jgi:hypothetical protein
MNARYLTAACLLFVSVAASAADGPAPARHELEFNSCMRTDRISNYSVVDDQTVIVANGPNFFKIGTDVACPRMGIGGGVRFKSSPANQAMGGGRICGSIGEQIVRRDDPPCQIISVEEIDKATYKQLEKKAKQKGAGPGISGAAK